MNTSHRIESGKLIIENLSTGVLEWSGDFEGLPVFKVLPINGTTDCLVLLDPGASKQPTFKNLLRVKNTGDIIWRAELPRSHDAYADVLVTNQGVEARSWQGIRVLVSLVDGSVEEIGFSK